MLRPGSLPRKPPPVVTRGETSYPQTIPVTCGRPRKHAMTKSSEHGENEYTREARRLSAKTGRDVCDILREMRDQAIRDGDTARERKIIQAEKFLGCRNRKKRKK